MPTQYTHDITAGNTFSAKSTDAGYAVADIFDDNNETGSQSTLNDVAGWWVKVDFGAGITKTVTKITMWTDLNYDGLDGAIKNFKLQGSANDSDWTDITTDIYTPEDSTKKTFEFSNTTGYRYYRILVVDGWHSDYVGLSELEMMETVPFPAQVILI